MPGAKRRKLGVRALNRLTDAQRAHLLCGCYFFDFGGEVDHFRDGAHRRQAWAAWRSEILERWDRPGRRPVALWEYDYSLGSRSWPREWAWPRPIASESEMVRHLLLKGELTHCRLNGIHRIDDEVAEIEREWRRWVNLAPMHYRSKPVELLLVHYGVPAWFTKLHLPAAIEAYERELADYRAPTRSSGR